MPSDPSRRRSEKEDSFAYPPAVSDMMYKEPSQRSKTTISTARSSLLSGYSQSDYTPLGELRPGDDGPIPPVYPPAYYGGGIEEEDHVEEGNEDDKKEERKKKKKSRDDSKRYDRHSSRRTMESSDRRKERRERHERRARTGDDRTAETSERRRERKERHERRRHEADGEASERRRRHERRAREGDDRTAENSERRRERKERHERRRHEGEGAAKSSSRAELPADNGRHRSHPEGKTRDEVRFEPQGHHEGAAQRPHDHHHHHERHHHDVHHADREALRREQEVHRRTPPPTELDVPMNIVVVPSSPPSDLEPDITDRRQRKARLKSDYDRLIELLREQNEIMERHRGSTPSEAQEPSSNEPVVDKLPATMHPLIAASDNEFQKAFDALARDSVFDDNFEQAFNEFSEHYLALSPWGEEDSIGNKGDEDEKLKASDVKRYQGDQDFIQIPLTPVARKDLTTSKEIKKSGRHDDRPRTPTLDKGILSSSARILDHKDKEKQLLSGGQQEFVEVTRPPYYRRADSSPEDDSAKKDKEKEDIGGEDFVHVPRKPYNARSRPVVVSNSEEPSGELTSSWARLHEDSPQDPTSEPPEDTADEKGRRKWKLLRGKRGQSKATV